MASLNNTVRQHFPQISPQQRPTYHTRDLQICRGSFVEVSQDIWDTVIPMLNSLLVRTVPTHVHVEDDDDSDMSSCEG